MTADEKAEIRQKVARRNLRKTWLTWGLLPLAVCLILVMAADSVYAASAVARPDVLDTNFQAIFAITAMLFLVAFTLDGHWTNRHRLARCILRAMQEDNRRAKADTLADYASVAYRSVWVSSRVQTVAGVATAVCAVLAAGMGLGISHALIILCLAASFQIYVLSRHPHYLDVLQDADSGHLALEFLEEKEDE
ncbi:MAG: hypothetical protein ACLFWB_05195 [Armatimonadota bacterium]